MPPKHSHEKFFRKFFQITPRRLFADFLARICDEGNGRLLPAYGGGTPFCRLVGLSPALLRFFPLSLVAPAMQAAPALSLVAFPLSLWASVPDWLTASGSTPAPSGAPEPIGAAGPVVFLVLLGGGGLPFLGPASVRLSVLDSLGASGPPATGQNGSK